MGDTHSNYFSRWPTRFARHLVLPFALAAACGLTYPVYGETTKEEGSVPSHPEGVALVDEGRLGWVYRQNPSSLRLYTYDRDPPGRSVCNAGCQSAWPPVLAPSGASDVGEWSVITRDDGTSQWALKGKPVYIHYHDAPAEPTGDGVNGVWHLIPHVSSPKNPTLESLGGIDKLAHPQPD